MKHFTIENETNNITVCASAEEAETIPNAERFRNEVGLAKLAADWPMARLVDIWNSLPGVTAVNEFKDRATAVNRIWKGIQTLDACAAASESEPQQAVVPEPAAAVDATAVDVAPEQGPSTNEATPGNRTPAEAMIDKVECDRLLKLAAGTQRAYWNALRNLERSIGFEMDDPGDLNEVTVDDLTEQRAERSKPRPRRAAATGSKAPRGNSKTSQVIEMLKREGGTTIEEIMAAMGWQKHTTRAMLSAGGSRAKNHGLNVQSELAGDQRRYYIKD